LTSHIYNIQNLQVFEDSRVIIDWATNKQCLQNIALEPWKKNVKDLLTGFLRVNIKHTWLKFNQVADSLSKQALQLEDGNICLSFLKDGNIVFSHLCTVF